MAFILLAIPLCTCVQVFSAEGNEGVGMIKKMWGGEAKEQYTDAENFEIKFNVYSKLIYS